jgi:hemerythrin-like metal-binding protein
VKFDWNQIFELGLPEVDDDHREMLTIMKSIEAAASTEDFDLCSDLLDKLVETTKSHFRREENLLEEAGYPDVHLHAKCHAELIDQASQLKAICKPIKSREKFEDFSWKLFQLFLDEVVSGDLHFKSYLQDRGIIKGY